MTTLARWARAEWGPLYAAVRGPLRERRPPAVPMAVAAVCLTAVLHFAHNQLWGYRFVQDIGAVRAEDPLWLALLRTPLSLFVPALDLPVWGALAQILLVFGIAELCLGRRRTLLVAYLATLAGTLYARLGIWLGPDVPLGLPASDARVVDTGPSAAVVGLAVCLGWRYRAYVTAGAVIVAMVAEIALKENLAGKEHLAAIMAVLVVCAVGAVRRRRVSGVRGTGPAGGRARRRSSPGTRAGGRSSGGRGDRPAGWTWRGRGGGAGRSAWPSRSPDGPAERRRSGR
ncbi:hypothetical protein HDA41_002230 [Streptomyces caelestis]|uniref:Uncharacterized protein n=1 Tax=Streptomyces caelestis TaxID=36816 RepID=A0A7W9H2M4_9ACTN|nr:hypothetical protein [Streptomyces caelestis]